MWICSVRVSSISTRKTPLSDPGYALVNLQLGYRINNWEFSIWGKNVFDEEYVTKKLVSNEQTIVEDGNPMTFGTTIIWRF